MGIPRWREAPVLSLSLSLSRNSAWVGITTDYFSEEQSQFQVLNSFFKNIQNYLVIDTIKEFFNVTFQGIARVSVVFTHFSQHFFKCLNSFVCSFANSAGKGIGDKSRFKNRIEYLKQGVMQNPIPHGRFVNVPTFGVVNEKTLVWPVSVYFFLQVAVKLKNILFQIFLE